MEASIKLGRVWAIPIGLHFSWFFIFALVTWSLASGYFPAQYPELRGVEHLVLGIITSLLFFGSVLAHELGHAWVARRNGIAQHHPVQPRSWLSIRWWPDFTSFDLADNR